VEKVWRCKVCGERSYTGEFCLNCDKHLWRSLYRRGWLQVWLPATILIVVSLVLASIGGSSVVFWTIWSIGMLGMALAGTNTFVWGKKIIRRKFTQIQD